MPPYPTPSEKCARCFRCRIGMTTLWSACATVCRVNKWFADDVLCSFKGEFLPKSDLSCYIDNIWWMEWYPSIIKTFCDPAFPAQGISTMLVSPGKGSCRHHRFAGGLARCKQWVPGRLIGLGIRSFRLKLFQQNPIFCELWKIMGFQS